MITTIIQLKIKHSPEELVRLVVEQGGLSSQRWGDVCPATSLLLCALASFLRWRAEVPSLENNTKRNSKIIEIE